LKDLPCEKLWSLFEYVEKMNFCCMFCGEMEFCLGGGVFIKGKL